MLVDTYRKHSTYENYLQYLILKQFCTIIFEPPVMRVKLLSRDRRLQPIRFLQPRRWGLL